VTAANSSVPLLSKTMLTPQAPVLTPWLFSTSPLEASLMVDPATSVGPRMYL